MAKSSVLTQASHYVPLQEDISRFTISLLLTCTCFSKSFLGNTAQKYADSKIFVYFSSSKCVSVCDGSFVTSFLENILKTFHNLQYGLKYKPCPFVVDARAKLCGFCSSYCFFIRLSITHSFIWVHNKYNQKYIISHTDYLLDYSLKLYFSSFVFYFTLWRKPSASCLLLTMSLDQIYFSSDR